MTKRRGLLLSVAALLAAANVVLLLLPGETVKAEEPKKPQTLLSMSLAALASDEPSALAQLTPDGQAWEFEREDMSRPPAVRLSGTWFEGIPGTPGVGAAVGLGDDRSFGRAVLAIRRLAASGVCGVAIFDPDFTGNGGTQGSPVLGILQTKGEGGKMENCVPDPEYVAPDDPRLPGQPETAANLRRAYERLKARTGVTKL